MIKRAGRTLGRTTGRGLALRRRIVRCAPRCILLARNDPYQLCFFFKYLVLAFAGRNLGYFCAIFLRCVISPAQACPSPITIAQAPAGSISVFVYPAFGEPLQRYAKAACAWSFEFCGGVLAHSCVLSRSRAYAGCELSRVSTCAKSNSARTLGGPLDWSRSR